jgi:hypothetical protein
MKKVSFITALFFCALLVWKFHEEPQLPEVSQKWMAYEKDSEKLIVRQPAPNERVFLTPDETAAEQKNNETQGRSPASSSAQEILFGGRTVMGSIDQEVLSLDKELKSINEPDSDWQNLLANYLLDTQESDTVLFLKHLKSGIMVRGDQGRYTEEVLVTFQLSNKNISSYIALVDAQTGSLINTWSPTINHNFRTPPPRLSPSGAIFSQAQ